MNKKRIAVIVVAVLVIGAAAGVLAMKAFGNDSGEVYNVEYNTNGGYTLGATTFTKDTDTFELPIPTKSDSTFLGWYESSDFSGEMITSIVKGTAHDVTLWAKWRLEKSAIPTAGEMESNTDINVVFKSDSSLSEKTITEDVLKNITPGKTLTLTTLNKNDTMEMSWTFDGSKPVQGASSGSVLASTKVLDVKVEPNRAGISSSKEVVLKFSHSGKLPFESTIKYYLGDDFKNKLVTISNSADVEPIGQILVDSEGYVEFTIDHCSDWIITQWITLTFKSDVLNKQNLGGKFEDGTQIFVTGKKYADQNSSVKLPVATNDGYMFVRWVEEGTNIPYEGSLGSRYSEDKVFKAEWTPITYTISISHPDYINNSITYNIETAAFTLVSKRILDPTRTGYVFDGWYKDQELTDGPVTSIAKGTFGDFTLYPKWIPVTMTVTYMPDGGTMESDSFDVTYGQCYTGLEIPEKYGYTFLGWYLEANYQTVVTEDTVVSKTADHRLYAKWVPIEYNVTYNTGFNDTVVKDGLTYNVTQEVILVRLSKAGYDFNGWYDNPDLTGEKVTVIAKGSTGDLEFYAKWAPAHIGVTLDAEGGSIDTDTITVTYGSDYPELGEPVRTGYTFAGWFTEGFLKEITKGTQVTNYLTHSLHAKWTPIEYSITYNVCCNDDGEDIEITDNLKYTIESEFDLVSPQRTGYVFLGWYKDPKYNEKITSIEPGLTGDIELWAQWKSTNCYALLDANGGTIDNSSVLVTFGQNYPELGTPSRTAYGFDGWYLDRDFETEVTSDTVVDTYLDHTLYAKWVPTVYSITYETGFEDLSVTDNLTYTIESDFTLSGLERIDNIFLGWYSDEKYQNKVTSVTPGQYGDMTLWARWADVLKIVVTLDGEVYPDAVVILLDERGQFLMDEQSDSSYIMDVTGLTGTFMIFVNDILAKNAYQIIGADSIEIRLYTISISYQKEIIYSVIGAEGQKIEEPTEIIKNYNISSVSSGRTKIDFDTYIVTKTEVLTALSLGTSDTKVEISFQTYIPGMIGDRPSDCSFKTIATRNSQMPYFSDNYRWLSCDGYTFDGFQYNGTKYYDKDYNSVHVCDFTAKSVTLYAIWIPVEKTVSISVLPTVSYTGTLGTGWVLEDSKYTKKFVYGTNISLIYIDFGMTPVKAGYTFTEWSCVHAVNKYQDFVDGDLTISPQFTIVSYNVNFQNDGSICTTMKDVKIGDTVIMPLMNDSEERWFVGWTLGTNTYNGAAILTVDATILSNAENGTITFIAKWDSNTYTIHFSPNGGIEDTKVNDIQAKYGDVVDLPVPTYSSTNGSIAYWWKNSSSTLGLRDEYLNKVRIDDSFIAYAVNNEITLSANWVAPKVTDMEVGDVYLGTYTVTNVQAQIVKPFFYAVIGIGDYTYSVKAVSYGKVLSRFECIKGTYPMILPDELVLNYNNLIKSSVGTDMVVLNIDEMQKLFSDVPKYSVAASDSIGPYFHMTQSGMITDYFDMDASGTIVRFCLEKVYNDSSSYYVDYKAEENSNESISYGSKYYPTPDEMGFTKLGYVFQYWVDSGNSEIRYYPGEMIVGFHTRELYAKWEATDIRWIIIPSNTLDVTVNGCDASSMYSDAGIFFITATGMTGWHKDPMEMGIYTLTWNGVQYYAEVVGSQGVNITISANGTGLCITFFKMDKYVVSITIRSSINEIDRVASASMLMYNVMEFVEEKTPEEEKTLLP